MKREVDYKKAWEVLMEELKQSNELAHQVGWRILERANKILKQCTKKKKEG